VKSKAVEYNVSDTQWNKNAATSLCKSLSPAFQKGVPYSTDAIQGQDLDLNLTIMCSGEEKSFGECALIAGKTTVQKYASVVCYDKFSRYTQIVV
jgi:hypothetical protein